VIAALQDHVIVLAGVCARQSQPRHHRLRAGIRKAHEFGGRHHLGDAFGHLQLALRRQREDAAHVHPLARRRIDAFVRVSQDRGPIAHAVVDVDVVVEIDDARTLAALHVDGPLLAPVAEIGRDAQRQPLHGALEMRVVVGELSRHDRSPSYAIGVAPRTDATLPPTMEGVHEFLIWSYNNGRTAPHDAPGEPGRIVRNRLQSAF